MMKAYPKIDMAEVTRLTRAGQLSEAMALLQGQSVPPASDEVAGETIDMVAPAFHGGAWTAPAAGPTATDHAAHSAGQASARPGLAETIRALRERFPKMGDMPDFGKGMPDIGGGTRSSRGATVEVPAGARFEERSFANAAGSRTYKVYVPSGYEGQALPVVIMLHGCTQNPDDFALGTGMNALAEEQTFIVAYPGQPQSANMQKCWNWFNGSDQQRGSGEPSLISGIALEVVREFSADPNRVYAAGLSAGGAAAAIMAATYPDVFAAVGVHSGLPCGAATDMPGAFAAMNGGGTVKARKDGPGIPTIVFHGDADKTVKPINGEQVFALAMPNAALSQAVNQGESAKGMAFTRTVRADDAGRPMLEHWALHGAGHAWSGGSRDGSYTDPRGPDASREMVRFFMTHTKIPS